MYSPQKGLSRIVVHALVHATEDETRVRTAIENLFPEDIRPELKYRRTQLRGHHHNPITHLEVQLTDEAALHQTVNELSARLPPEEHQELRETLSTRTNQKGQLFLRFDKQESYQGRLRLLSQGDSLRVMIGFTGRKISFNELQQLCQQFNLI